MSRGIRPKRLLWVAVAAWLAVGVWPAMGQEKVSLTFGDNPYGYANNSIITYQALYDGIVKPEGVDLQIIHSPIDAAERLMMAGQRDLGVMAFLAYFTARAKGLPLVALAVEQRLQPTEPSVPPGNALYVRAAAGIDHPKKLEGKKIGLPLMRSASSLVTQAILKDKYGVDLSKITWVDKPPPILYQLLQSGEIDATNLYGEPSYRAQRDPSGDQGQGPASGRKLDHLGSGPVTGPCGAGKKTSPLPGRSAPALGRHYPRHLLGAG